MTSRRTTQEDSGYIDVRDLAAGLWSRKWTVIAIGIIASLVAVLASFIIRPTYRSTVVLMPAFAGPNDISDSISSALGSLGGISSLVGLGTTASDQATQEALAVLRSRQFTEAFIVARDLLPTLYSDRWDEGTDSWRRDGESPPTLAKAFTLFNDDIRTISEDARAGLIFLHIDWHDPLVAADWANDLVKRLNDEMRDRAIRRADDSVAYLERELSTTSTIEIREAINRIVEAQIRQRMLASVSPDFAFRTVDKALPADPDDPISPRRALFFVGGPVAGFALGLLVAAILYIASTSPTRRASRD